jgi:hypothetical protein
MKQTAVVILIVSLIISSCCETVKKESKIVEKMCGYNPGSNHWKYTLLFENGREETVESYQYANAKIGDVWIFNECK